LDDQDKKIILENCPHCGNKLTPWQQVLLQVDRMIVCKNCWYRIILDIYKESNFPPDEEHDKSKEKEG
jgi:DNA-directed RNA polymerase subunit RPC12/RpoP